jgi:hypothetical protein
MIKGRFSHNGRLKIKRKDLVDRDSTRFDERCCAKNNRRRLGKSRRRAFSFPCVCYSGQIYSQRRLQFEFEDGFDRDFQDFAPG